MTDIMWILAATAAVLVLVLAVLLVVRMRHSRVLRRQFGAEYQHEVESAGSRKAAEKELDERRKRVAELELHALPPNRKGELRESWRQVESDFVDHPAAAVAAAEDLLRAALRECGYPVGSPDYHPEDLSVEHAEVMEDYRRAARIAERSQRGKASTEDLRQAMQGYREVFESLVEGETAEAATPRSAGRAS